MACASGIAAENAILALGGSLHLFITPVAGPQGYDEARLCTSASEDLTE